MNIKLLLEKYVTSLLFIYCYILLLFCGGMYTYMVYAYSVTWLPLMFTLFSFFNKLHFTDLL